MRLRQTRVKTFAMRPRVVMRDNEGVSVIRFGSIFTVKGYLWDGAGDRQQNEYGETVANSASMRVEGEYKVAFSDGLPYVLFADGREIHINDGVYLYADTKDSPDYLVTRFIEYHPLKLEVKNNGEYDSVLQGLSES